MLIPVVLSGGAGTRLWPVSRESHPKPFMNLADGESLLLKTYRRAAAVARGEKGVVLTVTNRDHYFMSRGEFSCACQGMGARGLFMLEPEGRNTAPAIALAAHFVAEIYGDDALMLVLAADHLIHDQQGFSEAVQAAASLARQGKLATFGILPSAPETGYGYIEAGAPLENGRVVRRFVEKPSLDVARGYLAAGNFYWNSGMFCFTARAILDEIARHAPDVGAAVQDCWDSGRLTARAAIDGGDRVAIPADLFRKVPDISLDYAVMERSSNVVVVSSRFDWSDVGSWAAVKALVSPDEDNNRASGEAIFVDSKNTFVQSSDRLVAAVGIDNLMIIDTPDALLVANPDKAQDVKKLVAKLKLRKHETCRLHRTVKRPWGAYTVLEEGERFKIKRIEVKPGGSLSLQMHHHRSEHWVVVAGVAHVVNGGQELLVGVNQSTYIPAGHRHRLRNPGDVPCVLIEVQTGGYLGEDDIVRFEDRYGRTAEPDVEAGL